MSPASARRRNFAEQLIAQGLECYRIQFPKGMDANEYALKLTAGREVLGARDPQGGVAR